MRRTCRESAKYGSPVGVRTSQIMRPTARSPDVHGRMRNDAGSGIAIMSDSSMALNPVTDEPSKPIPCMTASSSSRWVIAKLFNRPTTSVNHSWMKVMSSSFTLRITSARRSSSGGVLGRLHLAPFPVLGMKKAPGRDHARPLTEASSPRASAGIGGGGSHRRHCSASPGGHRRAAEMPCTLTADPQVGGLGWGHAHPRPDGRARASARPAHGAERAPGRARPRRRRASRPTSRCGRS